MIPNPSSSPDNVINGYMDPHAPASKPHLYALSVTAYHRMGEAGILDVSQRTELVDGRIIAMAPIGSEHADWVNRLNRFFVKMLPEDIAVAVQNPVYLSETSEPEPDIALLRSRSQPYREAHPRPEDVLLLIEVADSSLGFDRDVKVPLYAQNGIPEVWLVDIAANRIEVFREPRDGEYRVHLKPDRKEVLGLFSMTEIQVELAALF